MEHFEHPCGRSRILVGPAAGALARVLPAECRTVVVTDAGVVRAHPELTAPYATILVGRGERCKTFAAVERVCRELLAADADRATFVLGVGGGIVTDIAGFAASVYMRGVRFGFVSTTLLGQVDAAVGGKNGVNVDGYKNIMGLFRQPEFVVCDPTLTGTLPDREFRAGLAEALKAGIVGDAALFARIERASYGALRGDAELLARVVEGAVGVKCSIVAADECEAGVRRKLNLGHTLAHAIEKCSDRMNHGEAVAVGLALVARASVRLGLLCEAECRRIERVLRGLGFELDPPVPVERLLREVVHDKKREGGVLHAVLPEAVGSCTVRPMSVAEFAALFA